MTKTECAPRFREQLESMSLDAQIEFFNRREALATQGAGSILMPAPPGVLPRAPFDSSKYPHYKDHIGDIYAGDWRTICKTPPQQLFNPILSKLSSVRAQAPGKPKWQAWDAVVGIPASAARQPGFRTQATVKPIRNCNKFWSKVLAPALLRWGPLGKDGAPQRPGDKFILDLTKLEPHLAHQLMEVAHVIAHRRGDTKREARSYGVSVGRTAGQLRGILAEIVVAMFFDLPIDVSARDADRPGEPDLPYGLEIKTTSYMLKTPVLRLPQLKKETPRFDETLALGLVSVYIEPVPYGFTRHDGTTYRFDHWCCMPSIFTFCGWEGVDVITHLDIGKETFAPESWYVRVEDLLEPATLWNFFYDMYHGQSFFRPPEEIANIPGGRWWYVDDWIKTEEYQTLLAETPTFPCPTCLAFNPESPDSPKRPHSHRPEGVARKDMPQEWQDYYAAIDEVCDLLEPVHEAHEIMLFGGGRGRVRAARNRGYREKLIRLGKLDQVKKLLVKEEEGEHNLTESQQERLDAHRKEYGIKA